MRVIFFITIITIQYTLSSNNFAFSANEKSQIILRQIQKYMNSFDSISADFIQIDDNNIESTGHLVIVKPNKIRMDYFVPERIAIIFDKNVLSMKDFDLNKVRYYGYDNPLPFLTDKHFFDRSVNNIVLVYDKNSATLTVNRKIGHATYSILQFDWNDNEESLRSNLLQDLQLRSIINYTSKREKIELKLQNIKYNEIINKSVFRMYSDQLSDVA